MHGKSEIESTLFVDRLKNTRLSVSIPLLITLIGVTYWGAIAVTDMSIGWHDQNYARRDEVILLAEVEPLKEEIKKTQEAVDETRGQLRVIGLQVQSLQISAAISAVSSLRTELDRHERNPDDSISWVRERDRLQRQVERSVVYRDCLLDERSNCENLRGW